MTELFLKILNMSLAAGWLILAVILLRVLLKKAPRKMIVWLWGIAALRLISFWTFSSSWSLIPSAEIFSMENIQYEIPAVSSGFPALNQLVNPILERRFSPAPGSSVNPLYVWAGIGSWIWAAGVMGMLLYGIISWIRVERRAAEGISYQENIFLCDHIGSPFLLGLFRPKICLPSDIEQKTIPLVLVHEQAHLKRLDPWWKLIGFLILSIHWFNPLCWIAWELFNRDLELACDEKVIASMNLDQRKQYSKALLACSMRKPRSVEGPLMFGEIGVTQRIKTILKYRKPAFWISGAAAGICALSAICFLTNPIRKEKDLLTQPIQAAKRILTAEDILKLSQKKEKLSWSDFEPYQGEDVGFGMVILRYPTEEGFEVRIGGTPEQDPLYIFLAASSHPEDSIDLRSGNPEEFIRRHEVSGTISEVSDQKQDPSSPVENSNEALYQAVLDQNRSAQTAGLIPCASFVTLSSVSGTPPASGTVHSEIFYGWALYEEYQVTNQGLEAISQSHIPAVVTFLIDEEGRHLSDYWTPRDESLFVSDLQARFPPDVVEQMLDGQKFLLIQQQECLTQALEASGLNSEILIQRLLETLGSSPSSSSSVQTFIEAHPYEYQQLLRYGRFTLEYCFSRFESGNETGLNGQIMRRLCEEIASGWKEDLSESALSAESLSNSQLWYEAFKSTAVSRQKQLETAEFSRQFPVSWLLLQKEGPGTRS